MTPERLSKLRDTLAKAPAGPVVVRTGYMAGDRATIDITTEDYAYPPFVRLWSHPLMNYEQIPPHEEVLERLVAAYNALPDLLAHIDNLTRQIEACGVSQPKVAPKPPAKRMLLGDIQKLLIKSGALQKGGHADHE